MAIVDSATLVSGWRWKANQPLGINGNPIEGLVAWWKFNTGITETGSGVSQWDDQHVNAHHLLQTTDTNRPAKGADGAIEFDGVDNHMATNAFTQNQPTTVYILAQADSWTNNDGIFDGLVNSAGKLFQNGVTPNIKLTAGIITGNNTNFILGSYSAICVIFNGINSSILVDEGNQTGGNAGANNMGGLRLGANGTPSAFFHGKIKELILYNTAHNVVQRNKNISYLRDVGGLK